MPGEDLETIQAVTDPKSPADIALAMKDPHSPIYKKTMDLIMAGVAENAVIMKIMLEITAANFRHSEQERAASIERYREERYYEEKQQEMLNQIQQPAQIQQLTEKIGDDQAASLMQEYHDALSAFESKAQEYQEVLNTQKEEFIQAIKNADPEDVKLHGITDAAGNPVEVSREQVESMAEKAITQTMDNAIPALNMYIDSKVMSEQAQRTEDNPQPKTILPDAKSVQGKQGIHILMNLLGDATKLLPAGDYKESTTVINKDKEGRTSEVIPLNDVIRLLRANQKQGIVKTMEDISQKMGSEAHKTCDEFLKAKEQVVHKFSEAVSLLKGDQPIVENENRETPRPH